MALYLAIQLLESSSSTDLVADERVGDRGGDRGLSTLVVRVGRSGSAFPIGGPAEVQPVLERLVDGGDGALADAANAAADLMPEGYGCRVLGRFMASGIYY